MTTDDQARVCADVGVTPWEIDPVAVVGVGPLEFSPLNGLRHRPTGPSSGWYIWTGGEIPSDPDFFRSVHIDHLYEIAPGATAFLALPPGWRFQVAPDHEDVWADDQLLDT